MANGNITNNPLRAITPTLAEDLRSCNLRAFLRTKGSGYGASRLTPATALGLTAHRLFELAYSGQFDDFPQSNVPEQLNQTWNNEIAGFYRQMEQSWPCGSPPPPARWRGYNRIRIRLLYSLTKIVENRHARLISRLPLPKALLEVDLESSDKRLRGRVDRIEITEKGVHIIDIKSGHKDTVLSPAHRRQLFLYAFLWKEKNGRWPELVSIQEVDGTLHSQKVDAQESTSVVADTLSLLEKYNYQLSKNPTAEKMATVSENSCNLCRYREKCKPFFSGLNESWSMYRKCILGQVVRIDNQGSKVNLIVRVLHGNTHSQISEARILGVPLDATPNCDTKVAVIDVLPTGIPKDFRVDWRTTIGSWD